MPIADAEIAAAVAAYLDRYPAEKALLAEPIELLARGSNFASRRNFDLHVTVGALLTRGGEEILLVGHRAYGIPLQPGGHLEPSDTTLMGAAVRELAEETGIDPTTVTTASATPVYVEFGRVPARPQKDEPEHFHLDLGYAFTTTGDVGSLQESEVTSAAWYRLDEAERLVGSRVWRACNPSVRIG
ncbi:NUDIX hydrolase [Actinoplanes sp. SE50]|uniref:NUDIX hydrolase n=1 Tax=unclassified Actinoplanes TaxID=2626549 RepID=UPI00023EDD0A|nr:MULTISPECIES: NUDIX domain-containing protein [unclassified Actinoplanes]AEV89117.1 putative DHNTP pyrophosphohydrolase [Actinoplanes sp. SE50/110]ATO87523.1 NUDIX hydrolase [Actinoplanes sp. SE50]SLM04941.1 NUDIX hydrolase [Actinoplanes sp. SE50/110]